LANPRIDDLRKRLDKEPGSRIFAQLAEELRKEGEFEEAIRLCREGLQKNANYPSARMTLGRALFESGDLSAARKEFELVLKGAPDNILASRMLGESLEGLGELEAARERYKKTLAMAPGEKHVAAQLEKVERALKAKAAPVVPASFVVEEPEPEPEPAPAEPRAELPPIKLVEVNEPMELEKPYEPPTVALSGTAAAKPAGLSPASPPLTAPVEEVVEFDEAPTIRVTPSEQPMEVQHEELAPSTLPLGATTPSFSVTLPSTPIPAAPEATRQPETAPPPPATVFTTAPAMQPPPIVVPAPPPPAPEPEPEIEPEPEPPAPVFAAPPPPPPAPPAPAPEPPPVIAVAPAPPPAVTLAPPAPPAVAQAPEPGPPPAPVPPPAPPVAVAPEPAPPPAVTLVPPAPPAVAQAPEPEPPPAPVPPPAPAPSVAVAPQPPPPPPAPLPTGPPITDEIASVTLAELYFNQGFTDKATEVLKQLLQREPGNERARARLAEIEEREGRVLAEQAQVTGASSPDADQRALRRQAIERTIAQLEKLLVAIRRG
jgi:tetratricopeptide (TPR) repeat protein